MSANPLIFKLKAGLERSGAAMLTTPEVTAHIEAATPPEFPGGMAGYWSPETLLLGATVGCFLNTFQVFAKKMNLQFDSLECEATGSVDRVEGKFAFTSITLYPTLIVADEASEVSGANALDKAHRYCLISNSLKCPVEMEINILTTV